MDKINNFINRYFGVILLFSAVSGLFIPIRVKDLSSLIIITLACIIFSSFFKVRLDRQLFTEGIAKVAVYLFIRFILMPAVIFFLLNFLSPFYALIFFLLLVLPAAVSSPAFTAMLNGNVNLSLKILVLTSFLSILSIPGLSSLFLVKKIEIDTFRMFITMIYTIVIPLTAKKIIPNIPYFLKSGCATMIFNNFLMVKCNVFQTTF